MSRGAQRVEGLPVRLVDAGGISLAVLDVGTGPAVLLVPGFTGSKEDFGPVLAPLTSAGHRVVAVDLRGQLDSPGAGPVASYGPEGLAADLLGLLDTLGLTSVHLVGHSYGGLVARAALLARPAAFASLTLLCSGPGPIGGQRAATISRLRASITPGSAERLVTLLRASGARGFEADRLAASDATGLFGMGEALLDAVDRTDELAAVLARERIPVLVACGVADNAWPVPVQEEMAARLGARFVTIPGAGHSPAVEEPSATADLLAGFFA